MLSQSNMTRGSVIPTLVQQGLDNVTLIRTKGDADG